jgi:hypothetical protein
MECGVISAEGVYDRGQLLEVMEGSTVIAIDASDYSEIPKCRDMNEEISVPGGAGCLNEVWGRCLKITVSEQVAAEFEDCTFPVAGRRLISYFRQCDTPSVCLPILLLAIRSIVAAYHLKLRRQWERQDRLTDPVNYLRLTGKARVSGNGDELVAQNAEVLS